MKLWRLACVLVIVSGCAHTAVYKPEYVASQTAGLSPTIAGSALVVTEPAQDARVYTEHPSSFTGAGTTFRIKLGEFLRDITVEVLSKKFKGSATHASQVPAHSDYRIVVKPTILEFDYRYNQLKNLGLFITPEVKIAIQVHVYDANNQEVMAKRYESDFTSGGDYVASFKPAERINRAVHQVLFELIWQMAKDLEQHLT